MMTQALGLFLGVPFIFLSGWTLSIPILIVARLAHDATAEPADPEADTAARTRLAPLVAYAFTLPVFHFLMERLGIVEDETAGPRELVVLVFLGAAALLLWVYQRVAFGPLQNHANKHLEDLRGSEIAYMLPIVVLVIVALIAGYFLFFSGGEATNQPDVQIELPDLE